MAHQIPKIVYDYATKIGLNTVSVLDHNHYALGLVVNGKLFPTGLPAVVSVVKGKVVQLETMEAFKLLKSK